jgi:hypothetical protein
VAKQRAETLPWLVACPPLAHAADADAIILYFGHNVFQISTCQGTRIVTESK